MKINKSNIINCLLAVLSIFLQNNTYAFSSLTNQPVCENIPDLDRIQPYPNSWNQFNIGNDQGLEGDGELSFTIDKLVDRNNVAIGLDHDPATNNHWKRIDFAFYIIRTSVKNHVRIYENGVYRGQYVNTGASIIGYTFKIKRTEETVEYYINDELKYTSTLSSTDHLYYDNSCYKRTSASKFVANEIKLCVPGPADASTIKVNSAFVGGKIRLRWMTTEMGMWEHALKVGYTIERLTVADGDTYLSKNERIDSYVLLEEGYLPKSLSEMESATSNPNEGTLANTLVKDSNTEASIMGVGAGEQTVAKAVEQKNMRDIRYFYAHVLAEKSFEMACAMGMAYEDNTIESDKQYTYIITLSEPLN